MDSMYRNVEVGEKHIQEKHRAEVILVKDLRILLEKETEQSRVNLIQHVP